MIGLACHSTHLLHKGGSRFERFSPQHVHVNDRGQSSYGRRGAAAAVDGHMRHLLATNVYKRTGDPVEFALMIKRRRFYPGALQQGDILLSAAIAGIVVGEIPVSRLLCIAAPSDDVDSGASPAQVIKSGEL